MIDHEVFIDAAFKLQIVKIREGLATMSTSSSADSHRSPPTEHDVFLSFRGEDTRHNFQYKSSMKGYEGGRLL